MIRIDQIWLAVDPVDMRSGIDRLLARVVEVFGASRPHHAYVFANRRGTRLKVLVCDGFGIWLAVRRLHQGAVRIAQALDLVPSTCLHILRVLVAEKLLSFDGASKRYRLGTGMLVLARSVMETNSFAQIVQPTLDQISEQWGVTAIGVEIVDIRHMVVTALSRSSLPFRLHVDVGSRFPGLISATGRLVAAFGAAPKEEIEKQFSSLRWQKPISMSAWRKEVESARRAAFSLDKGRYIAGIILIAVPILDREQHIFHTIVAASIINQMPDNKIEALVDELKGHASHISALLYPQD